MSSATPMLWSAISIVFSIAHLFAWGLAAALAFSRRDTMPRTWMLLAGGFTVVLLRLVVSIGTTLLGSWISWSMPLALLSSASSNLVSLLITALALAAVFVDRNPEVGLGA